MPDACVQVAGGEPPRRAGDVAHRREQRAAHAAGSRARTASVAATPVRAGDPRHPRELARRGCGSGCRGGARSRASERGQSLVERACRRRLGTRRPGRPGLLAQVAGERARAVRPAAARRRERERDGPALACRLASPRGERDARVVRDHDPRHGAGVAVRAAQLGCSVVSSTTKTVRCRTASRPIARTSRVLRPRVRRMRDTLPAPAGTVWRPGRVVRPARRESSTCAAGNRGSRGRTIVQFHTDPRAARRRIARRPPTG